METLPAPIPNDSECITDLVVADLYDRKAHGIGEYGVCLQADNGRVALQDAYEETLDKAHYLKQELIERPIREERIRDEEQERIALMLDGVSPHFLRTLEDGKLVPVLVAMVRTPRADCPTGDGTLSPACPD